MSVFSERLGRVRRQMTAEGVDALVAATGADLPYLTGYRAMPLERLTALVVHGEGTPSLFVPRLEAPRVTPDPAFAVVPWDETDDPLALVVAALGEAGTIAVDPTLWARFVLDLQERLPGRRMVTTDAELGPLRLRKDPVELEALRAAARAADRVIPVLAGLRFSGRTEREIAAVVAEELRRTGHDEVDFTIVASGPNAASPHHEPTGRTIERGDTVVVDFGGRMAGYRSDTTRTFVVGPPPPEVRDAYAVLAEAQDAAVAAVAPGVPAEDIDRVARRIITAAGYGPEFVHRTGHGIGLETHEDPYLVEGNRRPLEPGMVFSVEPGIYRLGAWGMRIEDIVAVTASGAERLNRSDRRLAEVD